MEVLRRCDFMKIRISTVEKEGSCNYCDRGKLATSGRGLIFPYTELIVVEGKQISSVFCRDCFNELQNREI
jgi:hypothetical protein